MLIVLRVAHGIKECVGVYHAVAQSTCRHCLRIRWFVMVCFTTVCWVMGLRERKAD